MSECDSKHGSRGAESCRVIAAVYELFAAVYERSPSASPRTPVLVAAAGQLIYLFVALWEQSLADDWMMSDHHIVGW